MLLDEPDFTAAAVDAAAAAGRRAHWPDGFCSGRRATAWRRRNAGVLEDHGAVAEAFLAVLGVTGDAVWLDRARRCSTGCVDHFADPAGGFFDTADDAEALVVRPKDASDNAYPSGTSAAVHALLAFAAITGEHRYRAAAESGIASAASIATAGAAVRRLDARRGRGRPRRTARDRGRRVGAGRAWRSCTAPRCGSRRPGAVVDRRRAGLAIPLFEQRDLRRRPARRLRLPGLRLPASRSTDPH